MPQYLIEVRNGPQTRSRPLEQMQPIWAAVSELNRQAMDDGIFVFAGGLETPSASTTVDPRSGTAVLSDGPYLETKEFVGGVWIIEVPDLDAALEWSKRAALACQEVLEVRPFMALPDEDAA
jgi:hypothetical protein